MERATIPFGPFELTSGSSMAVFFGMMLTVMLCAALIARIYSLKYWLGGKFAPGRRVEKATVASGVTVAVLALAIMVYIHARSYSAGLAWIAQEEDPATLGFLLYFATLMLSVLAGLGGWLRLRYRVA
jgi:hypothetical protein